MTENSVLVAGDDFRTTFNLKRTIFSFRTFMFIFILGPLTFCGADYIKSCGDLSCLIFHRAIFALERTLHCELWNTTKHYAQCHFRVRTTRPKPHRIGQTRVSWSMKEKGTRYGEIAERAKSANSILSCMYHRPQKTYKMNREKR
jgi:hypothetical protein